jgi:hypothetical protein
MIDDTPTQLSCLSTKRHGRVSAEDSYVFSTENVINAHYNEWILRNSELNATEEAKELAWCQLGDQFGLEGAGNSNC